MTIYNTKTYFYLLQQSSKSGSDYPGDSKKDTLEFPIVPPALGNGLPDVRILCNIEYCFAVVVTNVVYI